MKTYMKKYVLSIDLGASSGRGIVFAFDGSSLKPVLEKRFENRIGHKDGTAFWNMEALLENIRSAIAEAAQAYAIQSLGVDTWGLDFGLIGRDGALIENPVSYRDTRTDGMADEVYRKIPRRSLYAMTGTQYLQSNTLYQLHYLITRKPELINRAQKLLMMPDLITYILTGEAHTEYTIASTMQLMDMEHRSWNERLIHTIGLSDGLFTDLVFPGEQAFTLRMSGNDAAHANGIPLVSVASHDTASAVIAIPAAERESLYLSSGTWSILGTELDMPRIDEMSFEGNFTNEGGFGKRIRYARSLMGLWLIQECVRCWNAAGKNISLRDIDEQLKNAPALKWVFDPEDPSLLAPNDMPGAVAALCMKNCGSSPQTVGEFARCIYESMALNSKKTVEALSRNTGVTYRHLYVVGGGSRALFLNECIANATGLGVIAGQSEATAYGNAFAQLYWGKELTSIEEFREMLAKDVTRFEPQSDARWEDAYDFFLQITADR